MTGSGACGECAGKEQAGGVAQLVMTIVHMLPVLETDTAQALRGVKKSARAGVGVASSHREVVEAQPRGYAGR